MKRSQSTTMKEPYMLHFVKKSLAVGIVIAFSFVICGCAETTTTHKKEVTTTDSDRDGTTIKKETTTKTKKDD